MAEEREMRPVEELVNEWRAAREPLLKRIEELEALRWAGGDPGGDPAFEKLKAYKIELEAFNEALNLEVRSLSSQLLSVQQDCIAATKALAAAKAEGRREAIEEVRRMIRRWEMAREQAGASEIRNVYADYLSAGDVILAAIDALAREGGSDSRTGSAAR